jgi:hypothetical protein
MSSWLVRDGVSPERTTCLWSPGMTQSGGQVGRDVKSFVVAENRMALQWSSPAMRNSFIHRLLI